MLNIKSYRIEEMKVRVLLALHCTPVMRKIKISNTLTAEKSYKAAIGRALYGTDISLEIFRVNREKVMFYLYRKEALRHYLLQRESADFLEQYGYKNMDLNAMLERLTERIRMFREEKNDFPHEIGIFLGYPVNDVKGFLENRGKNYIYAGYWKVYDNASDTMKLFDIYDEERERVMTEILNGKQIHEIVV